MRLIVQRGLRSWPPSIGPAVTMGLLIVLLSASLIACGPQGNNQAHSTSTTPQESNQPSFTATPSAQAQQCGKVQTGPQGALLDATAAKQATNCFWQAFQHCNSASLTFTAGGVDTVVTRNFTLESKSNQCVISETTQTTIAPSNHWAAKTYICNRLVQQSDGLHFSSCGEDGDVIVPSGAAQ